MLTGISFLFNAAYFGAVAVVLSPTAPDWPPGELQTSIFINGNLARILLATASLTQNSTYSDEALRWCDKLCEQQASATTPAGHKAGYWCAVTLMGCRRCSDSAQYKLGSWPLGLTVVAAELFWSPGEQGMVELAQAISGLCILGTQEQL